MRFRKSLKNLIAGWAGQFFIIIMNLISKRVFVNVLGEEYLGIGGLFSNLLSVLSLAELGISACINYSLYKPLAEKNKEEIKSIMYFYKRVYKVMYFGSRNIYYTSIKVFGSRNCKLPIHICILYTFSFKYGCNIFLFL